MSAFVETICVIDGIPQHLALHQARLARTWQYLGLPADTTPELSALLPLQQVAGRCKWRVVYTAEGITSSELAPYMPRSTQHLRLVDGGDMSYTYKSTDRSALEHCYAQRGTADDVLIVRHGLLTDTTIANIALYDGTQWHTPEQPLLAGIQREFLLTKGQITAHRIAVSALHHYTHIALFNAMLPWGEVVLPMDRIDE